jgi:molybdopterin/thiamine biosynthesis adenylyltransferase
MHAARELSAAGEIRGEGMYPFEFANVDMSMDSYRGSTVRLRYLLRVTVSRGMGGISEDFPMWVRNPCRQEMVEEPIKVSPVPFCANKLCVAPAIRSVACCPGPYVLAILPGQDSTLRRCQHPNSFRFACQRKATALRIRKSIVAPLAPF